MVRFIVKAVLYVLILIAGIFAAENIDPFFDGSKEPPPKIDILVLESTLSTAVKHGAKEFFLRDYENCEFEIESAKRVLYSEFEQPYFLRDFTYAKQKISEAQDNSLKLLTETAEQERITQNQYAENISKLEKILSNAKNLLSHTSNSTLARQRFASAEIYYKSAKRLYEEKRLVSAVKESSKGLKMAEKSVFTSKEILSRFLDPDLIRKWLSWKQRAIVESRSVGSAIVVNKEKHILELYKKGSLLRTFSVEIGANSTSQKFHAGDRATPEGYYHITAKKGRGQSKYYMALLINYPNNEDKVRFNTLKAKKELGSRSSIGGLIEIHGGGGQGFDWTDGCIALPDSEMEYLFKQVSVGTPVAIIGSEGNGPINSALKEAR